MLKIRRISRGIITAIYILILGFVSYLAVAEQATSNIKAYQIFIYMLAIVFCVCFYQVIKRRLKNKINIRRVRRIYRFSYFAVILVVSRIIMIYLTRGSVDYSYESAGLASYILKGVISITGEAKYAAVIIGTVISYVNCVLIKKIMLNVFENDLMATMSGTMYILSPISFMYCLKFDASIFNTLFVLLGIYIMLLIYDNITVYGEKSFKYVILSVILGVICTLDILFGGSIYVWGMLLLVMYAVTNYIDRQAVKVDKIKWFKNIFKRKDKIYINKLIIAALCVLVFGIVSTIIANSTGLNIYSFNNNQSLFASVGRLYMLFSIIAIVFELLSLTLDRKGDAKISVIKAANIIFALASVYFTGSFIIYEAIFSMAFVASICNMYYSREDKIKLLKSSN